jgi:hypothetical protein
MYGMNIEILIIEAEHRTSIPTIVAAAEVVATTAKTIAMATEQTTRVCPIVGAAGHVASLVTETTTVQTRNRLTRRRLAVPLTTRIATLTTNRTRKPSPA